jgi:hypothetical protein
MCPRTFPHKGTRKPFGQSLDRSFHGIRPGPTRRRPNCDTEKEVALVTAVSLSIRENIQILRIHRTTLLEIQIISLIGVAIPRANSSESHI